MVCLMNDLTILMQKFTGTFSGTNPMPKADIFLLNGQDHSDQGTGLDFENRAFRYGDGLFETICIRNGKYQFVADHWKRLEKGMQILGLHPPERFTEILNGALQKMAEKSGSPSYGRARVQVWRSGTGTYQPTDNSIQWAAELSAFDQDPWIQDEELTVGVYPEALLAQTPLSAVKSCNALPYILAAKLAQENSWHDCLLQCQDGLSEASSSNLFIVQHGQLFTPALSSGCLPGIMRKQVLEAARQLDIRSHEMDLHSSLLQEADEIFLTNVIKGIQVVRTIEGRILPQVGNPIADRLRHMLAGS